MPTRFLLTRDIAGFPTTGSQTSKKFTDTAQYFDLTAATPITATVPSNGSQKMMACFQFGKLDGHAVVWVQPDTDSVIAAPTGTVTATTAEMNPSCREVVPGQEIQFLTEQSDVSVSITYYQLNDN